MTVKLQCQLCRSKSYVQHSQQYDLCETCRRKLYDPTTAEWVKARLTPSMAPHWMNPVARTTDPTTSHEAAGRAKGNAETNRALALKTLRANPGGLTDFELADRTGVPQTSIGVRRGELVRAGLVRPTDMRRQSPSGSSAIVWVAV